MYRGQLLGLRATWSLLRGHTDTHVGKGTQQPRGQPKWWADINKKHQQYGANSSGGGGEGGGEENGKDGGSVLGGDNSEV